MKSVESSLKEIWINKLTSIKEKKIKSNNSCVKGKEILNILDNNNLFWIKWYELLNKEIASFYLNLKIVDIKENGVWSEVTFDIGQDIILKEAPDEIQRIRGERFFAKLKKYNEDYYVYTLKEIINNKLYDIQRFYYKNAEELYKKYCKLTKLAIVYKERNRLDYKRHNAISYAYRFNRFRNKYFPFINDNNTTNYISQCIDFGGIKQKKSIWYCKPKSNSTNLKLNDFEITQSWYEFDDFYKFLIDNKIGREVKTCRSLVGGDIIQLYSSRYLECNHTMLVTKIINDEIYITSQYKNKSYMDYPLYLLFADRNINRYRFIEIS